MSRSVTDSSEVLGEGGEIPGLPASAIHESTGKSSRKVGSVDRLLFARRTNSNTRKLVIVVGMDVKRLFDNLRPSVNNQFTPQDARPM